MKLAVSDFDGTLYFHQKERVPQINLDAIKKWRSAGNLFCFCSGRDMRSLMDEVGRYDFAYDYVICNNGATLFDKNLRLLKSFPLDKTALSDLLNSNIAAMSHHLLFSAADKMEVTIQHPDSPLWLYFTSPKYTGQKIIRQTTPDRALKEINTVQLSCAYDDEAAAKAVLAQVEADYTGIFSAHRNMNYLDVCSYHVSKANGIKELLSIEKLHDVEVLTIGDSQNDISMLKAYTGFSLHSATSEAKHYAAKLYGTAGEMLLDNLLE